MSSLEFEGFIEEDVCMSSIFPKELPDPLQPLVEYRIKLSSKNNYTIHAGETRNIATNFILNKKMLNNGVYLKPYEFLPLIFESTGFVHPRFTGRIIVGVSNCAGQDIKIPCGTTIGYALLQPYFLK